LKDKYLSDWRNRQNEFFLQRLNMQNPETAILSNQAAMWGQTGANAFNAGGSLLANGLGDLNGIGGYKIGATRQQKPSTKSFINNWSGPKYNFDTNTVE